MAANPAQPAGGPRKAMELLLHPGDEFLGSLEAESLQVLVCVQQNSIDHCTMYVLSSICA